MLNNKDSTKLIIAYSFGSYQKYIPLFICSVFDSLIDVDILIISPETIENKIKKRINKLNIKGNYKLMEKYNPLSNFDYSNFSSLISKNQFYRFIRYIIEEEYFDGYSEVYIGDIDICYLSKLNQNKSSLFIRERSIANMNKFGFNNIMRTDLHGDITYRLGGLHYIQAQQYFSNYGKIIKSITRNEKQFYNLIIKAKSYLPNNEYLRDEHLLFAMLVNEDNLEYLTKILSKYERRMYGIHLSQFRNQMHAISCYNLFGIELLPSKQKVLLKSLLILLIKQKLHYFFFTKEFKGIFKYYYKLYCNSFSPNQFV